jgi:hypothetical protein
MTMREFRDFTVKTDVQSFSKAGSSAPNIKSGPTVRVRVSTATMMRPSASALNAYTYVVSFDIHLDLFLFSFFINCISVTKNPLKLLIFIF